MKLCLQLRRLATVLALSAILSWGVSEARADGAALAGLAVGNNADGRLEVFHVDAGGELRHRWQREFTHDWSSWSTLGSQLEPAISVVNDASGRLGVFAVNYVSHTVEYNFQGEPNSPEWSNWTQVPCPEPVVSVVAKRDGNGHFLVFVAGGQTHSVRWTCQTNEGWAGWSTLGGNIGTELAVAQTPDGLFHAFGIDRIDGTLVTCHEASAGHWGDWSSLGERILPGFAVGQNADGRLEVVGAHAPDGEIFDTHQMAAFAGSGWCPWQRIGPKMKPGIAIGRNEDGRIEVFAVDPATDMMFHVFQAHASSTNWVGWTDMSLAGANFSARHQGATERRLMDIGNPLTDVGSITISYPVVGSNSDARLELFAFGPGRERPLNHRRQIAGSLLWADWSSMDRSAAQYLSRTWRIDDGLPDNRVQAIAQTPDGYIWAGTRSGLARFDGLDFTTVPLDVLGMTTASITSLAVDKRGALWVGSDGGGVIALSRTEARRYTTAEGLVDNRVTAICNGNRGSLWIGTRNGLSLLKDGVFVSYSTNQGLLANGVRSLMEDSDSTLWIATEHGVNMMRDGTISVVPRRNGGLPDTTVTGFCQDVPGRYWVGSEHGLLFARRALWFFPYDEKFGLTDRFVNVIANDHEGGIWVGTYSGLSRFREGRFFDQLDNEGHSFGNVESLFADAEGDLWVGSDNGLSRLSPKSLVVYGQKEGLAHNKISAVVEDETGRVWVGTHAGLNQLNGDAVTTYSRSTGFPLEAISCLYNGPDGSLWAGAADDQGVVCIHNATITHYMATNGLASGKVDVICEDNLSNVWIGTVAGLSLLRNGRFVTNAACQAMAGRDVRALSMDLQGRLWVGTVDGLYSWNGGQIDRLDGLVGTSVTAIYCDNEGSLWIGTKNAGLKHYHDGHLASFDVGDGLFSNEIFDIVEDDYHWLWMSCSKGIFRARKQDLNWLENRRLTVVSSFAYGHNDGMASVLCSIGKPGAWKTRDGRLWFATAEGVVAINPRTVHVNNSLPTVLIEQLVTDGRIIHPTGGPLARFSFDAGIRIPPGENQLEIHYTALGLPAPEQSRFRYRLDGVDGDWVRAGARRVAYYNNLPPGQYKFTVIACNNEGIWTADGASIGITILPHVWETWWLRAACVLALAGAIGGSARYVTRRKMLLRLAQMQQRHAVELERTRIARDMHDELGAKLTRISFQGALARRNLHDVPEAATHVEKMAETARELVFSLDEIVWAVDPKNDSLDDLATYICRYATGFFEDTAIRCKFVIPPNLPECRLPTDLRHNIFLAVKEILNNILKHSQATRAEVQISANGCGFEINISDNGRGIHPATNGRRVGHGLGNLKERLAAVSGQCEISSVPGAGTSVRLLLPRAVIHLSD